MAQLGDVPAVLLPGSVRVAGASIGSNWGFREAKYGR